ncbi:YrdC family protein [Croceitalea dokdonensis DOKDO 023]|uniref:YrdC family protein n=1 Tax=Croceitalea dokdonensis DOKDO 023 TaxID=1300341 RepID=A0A0P7AUS3_9FLAO|nr:Sua5/YciO/YrdC/YwlC family protein [Croceitalea dokdonensis]KPM31617.1 YrdC family protein [Croceitalea dokdonensis DOKDO 023]
MSFQNQVDNSVSCLLEGGLLVYPTVAGWALGCDATNNTSIHRLRKTMETPVAVTLSILVANQAMMERFVKHVPEVAYDIFDLATKPTTLIFDQSKHLPPKLSLYGEVGVLIASSKFCRYLIQKLKKPIIFYPLTTTATSIKNSFSAIDPKILKSVDYVVNLQQEKELCTPSSIIKLTSNGLVQVIRE